MVDGADIPVREKMLRLQGSLRGKALETVRDLGFSQKAYERAKEKLKKKYGGKRRQTLTHLATLRGLAKIHRHHLTDLEELLAIVDRIRIALQDDDPDGEMKSQHLNLSVKEKIPEEDVRAYKYWLYEHSEADTFENLVQWIETRVHIMDEAMEATGEFNKKKNTKPDDKRHNRGFTTTGNRRGCVVEKCSEDHPPWVCQRFKRLPVTQRKELIAKHGRCFRCLASGHLSKNCPRSRECGIDDCKSTWHSRYLHDSNLYKIGKENEPKKPDGEQSDKTTRAEDDQTKVTSTKTYIANQVEHISLMVLPALIVNGSKKLRVNVMLDPCSTGSYITENAAEELQLEGRMQNLTISGTAGTEVKKLSRRVEVSVANVNGGFCAKLEANVLDNITGDTPAIQWSEIKDHWSHLKYIPFEKVSKRRPVDVLIGSDHPVYHQTLREVPGGHANDPIARQTNLGWVCFGPTLESDLQYKTHSHHSTRTYRTVVDLKETNELLRKFWELESLGIKDGDDQTWTPDELTAVKIAEETQAIKDGKYEIGIPWKKGEPKFDNNFEMAYSRLKNLEKSLMKKSPDVASDYNKIIEDYVDKNYVHKVPLKDEEQWLLPHFPVIKEDRTTTKVRIVYDAAAKDKGKCLNDAILPGPKLQRDLVDVLICFRRAPVGLSADICQMFLQVKLRGRRPAISSIPVAQL